jgi:plasmid stabilization system protein ParE
MKVVWSPRAIRRLTALRGYTEADHPQAAATVVGRIVIPYRVRAGRLDLIAIFHGNQKWPKRL